MCGSDYLLENDLIDHKAQETLLSKPPCHLASESRPREVIAGRTGTPV